MRASLAVAVLLVLARGALAAPVADLVVYWAPPDMPASWRDQARAAAGRAGAAFVDRSPAAATPPAASALVAEAIAAYAALRFDDAVAALDRAAAEIDETGGAGLAPVALVDLFLFRGLARIQRGDPAAWDDLVTAARIDPTRTLDPARFPPRAIEQLQRAQRVVAEHPRVGLSVTAAPACAVFVDGGRASGGRVEVVAGTHWLRVACPGHAPWGRRVVVSAPGVAVTATPAPITPPTGDEALIQARAAGARTVIDVLLVGGIARARLRNADGRELDRVTVALDGAVDGALDAALTRLLVPAMAALPRPRAWYRSRWVWAAGGALVAAAVLVPVALASGDGEREVVLRPTGWPPW